MPRIDEIQLNEDLGKLREDFLSILNGLGFPLDTRIQKALPELQALDPLTYAYDDGGDRILFQIRSVIQGVGYTEDESALFQRALLALEDAHGPLIGSILRNTAIPLPIVENPPPEVNQVSDGVPINLWYLTNDILGEESDEGEEIISYSRTNPVVLKVGAAAAGKVITVTVPTYVAVLTMSVLALAVIGGAKGGKNFFESIELGFKKVRRELKKGLRKLFSW